MKLNKLLPLLLASALLLSSCGIIIINKGKEEVSVSTEEATEEITYTPNEYPTRPFPDHTEEAAALVDALPDRDFDSHNVIIAAAKETGSIFSDSEEGAYVDSVLKRNSLISDKYNTLIVNEYLPASDLLAKVKRSLAVSEYYADFVAVRSGDLGSYYANGYIQNLKTLTYYDFSAKYFNQKAMDQITFGNVICGAVGSMTESPESYACLYFNKDLAEELGISLDYEMIYNREFTWDKLIAEMSSATDADTVFTASYDGTALSRIVLQTEGQNFLTKNSKGSLVSGFNTNTSTSVISTLKKLNVYRKDAFTFESISVGEDGQESTESITLKGMEIFKGGKALYAFGFLSEMAYVAKGGFTYEVLPLPKLTEGGSYNAAVSTNAPVLVMLKSSPNIDTNGYILQALGAASYRHMQSEYVKYAMTNCISSYYSVDMLELIIESPVYDHAMMFGQEYSQLRNGTYVAFYNAVTGKSSLSYYINKTKSALQKYLNARN